MKTISALSLFVLLSITSKAQSKSSDEDNSNGRKSQFGVLAGYNWSYITGEKAGFNSNTKNGYMAGVYFTPSSAGVVGYKTQIVYSRQGYTFDNDGMNTEVMNDYIYLPQFTTITIAKRFQLQAGAQIGFLLNAKKTSDNKDSSIANLMNRLDYGFAGGIEVNPIQHFIIGGRYNLGLGKLYKHYQESTSNPYPLPFNPETTNFKNAVVQFYLGYRF